MSSKDSWKEFKKHIVTCFASSQIFVVWFVADIVGGNFLQDGSIHLDFSEVQSLGSDSGFRKRLTDAGSTCKPEAQTRKFVSGSLSGAI